MSAAQTLDLAPTFPAYKLKHCRLILVLVYEFARGLYGLKARIDKALHENNQELMCILLSTEAVALPYLPKFMYYHLWISSLLLMYSFKVLRVQA